ncbi:GspE/PulE/PilB domain-containing protein [Geomonas subterranea]|uniref:General secretion pathway protein GspE n=1 Tax=Geomonas subterranea TaxID=2847989 RepID=A0ABX8LES2_9BACT|nr:MULTISPECIES: general secretion pathway protein GspE [Geomonas]QXE90167.1 general secretion pathway protein GspE [Geomonas subterranea]QXM07706.1 general secretion pathway protein GspE [Geomonas subterranea]
MAARLGEMLMKIGALDAFQLEQVLNAQAIYGGRLGTNLVEMGLVEEDQLARVLSEQLGVPCVDHDLLAEVPQSLLELLPLELAERYRALPVSLDGKRLMVAMADPSDFKAIDEIGFITGLVIIPRVCSELRLSIALERYYGIKRPVRYIPVQGGIRSRFAPPDQHAAVLESEWTGGNGEAGPPERVSLPELADRLAQASVEQEAVQALLAYVAGEFDRGALVKLKNGSLFGVQAVASGEPVPGFSGYARPLEEAPHLQRVVQERDMFLGEVCAGAEGALLQAMGGELPAPALLVPLKLGGQVAAVICAHDSHGRLGGGAFELQRVAVMAELSLEMIALRRRLVSV